MTGKRAGFTVFGTLTWIIRDSPPQSKIEAYVRRTGRGVFSTDMGEVEGGMPPVVVNGRVYAALGTEVVCFAIP